MSDTPRTEGELWARDELAALRAARFTPAAIARFLLHSGRRARRIRAARPELARTAYAWLAAGTAVWVALGAAGIEPFRRRVRSGLGWWALVALMLDWHLGMFETDDGRPRPLGLADALTLTRAWLVPVAARTPTPLVIAAAAATDALDGHAARTLAEPTRAGRDLEGLVDTCFTVAALRGLLHRGQLGRAPAIAEGTRLGAGFAYALGVYFGHAQAPDRALTSAARATTVVRATGLVLAGAGRERAANVLVSGGSAASVAMLARAAFRRA